MKTWKLHKGDTLVEVMFAVGIFGAVAIGAISLMNKGVSTSQTTLETTMARQEIDAQTEALRFIHGAYVAESNGLTTDYSDTWDTITARAYTEASIQREISDFFTKETTGNQSCAEAYDKRPVKAFALNSHNLGLTGNSLSGDVLVADAKLQLASTYPRMLYGRGQATTEDLSDVDVDEKTGNQETITREYLYAAEGIWVTNIASDAGGNDDDGVFQPDFYDFYIQTCWDQSGSGEASTISSIIRLYNPKRIVHDAQADAYSFRLIYNANGGSGAPATDIAENVTSSSHNFTISSTEPTRNRYRFLGWSTSPTATTAQYHAGDNFYATERATTLYAVWQRLYTYTLNYNANGGSSAPGSDSYGPTPDTNHTFTISSSTPTRSGYRFMGWSTSSSASHASYNSGSSIKVTSESTTLYAVWARLYNFTLTYNANGGSGEPAAQSSGDIITTSYTFTISSTTPSRSSYRFLGWAHSSSASQADYSAGDRITVSANTTLYAVWKRQYTLTLTYDANGGSNAPAVDTFGPSDSSSHTFTVSSGAPTRGRHHFLGWSTSKTATTASYSGGSKITLVANTTLYAVWQRYYNYTLTYDANGGSDAPSAQTSGETSSSSHKFTVSSTTPKRSGYNFLGWATTRTATSAEFQGGNELTVTTEDPVTLYAVWQPKYKFTLSYDANGGSGAPDAQNSGYVTTSSYAFTISSTKPTRTGYSFVGWATTKTATSAAYAASGSITVSANTTLYAVWKAQNRFYLYYNNNNYGGGVPDTQDSGYITGSSYTFTINNDPRNDIYYHYYYRFDAFFYHTNAYRFLGWSTDKNALTPSYAPGDTITVSANTTLYAVWDWWMQNWNGCDNLDMHQTIDLWDSRDNAKYTIIKLKDNRCWMQQDLAYTGTSLTPANSNVTENRTLDWKGNCASTSNAGDYPCKYNNGGQILYNYTAASAGLYKYSRHYDDYYHYYHYYYHQEIDESICPKGWHLPNHTEANRFMVSERTSEYFQPVMRGSYYFYTNHYNDSNFAYYWTSDYSHYSGGGGARDVIQFSGYNNIAITSSIPLIGNPIRCMKK